MSSETEIQRWTQAARRLLGTQDLQIHLSFNIHSGVPNHRALVRALLKEAIEKATPTAQNLSSVLTPGTRGPLSGIFFSLSHCRLASGFAFASRPMGFDIEDGSRVHLKLNARVSNRNDSLAAASSDCFWSAKESAFKAFSMDQSSTLSQIAITSWDETPDGYYLFEASTAFEGGRGVVTRIQALTLSIFHKGTSFSQ